MEATPRALKLTRSNSCGIIGLGDVPPIGSAKQVSVPISSLCGDGWLRPGIADTTDLYRKLIVVTLKSIVLFELVMKMDPTCTYRYLSYNSVACLGYNVKDVDCSDRTYARADSPPADSCKYDRELIDAP